MSNKGRAYLFGDLVDLISERANVRDASLETYISTENMVQDFGGVFPASSLPKNGSVTRFRVGDILFSNIRTYFKKVWQASFEGFCSNDVLVFRPKDETILLPNYLHHLCRSEDFTEYSARTSKGVKMPRGDKDALARFEVLLPTIESQSAISSVLDTFDNKIELNLKQNQTLESMAHLLFKAWFVNFEPVRAKAEGRWRAGQAQVGLPSHLFDYFPDHLCKSKHGNVPAGWRLVPADHLIEFNPKERLARGADAPYLDMASIPTSGSWPKEPINRAFSSGMRFRNGDTLMARITPSLENGKTAFIQCLPSGLIGWGSTEYIVMRSKPPVPPSFSYLLARYDSFREQAIRSMTGTSGRQRAQASSIAAFKLAVPDNHNVWSAFSRLITPIFDAIKINSESILHLTALRNTSLSNLIGKDMRASRAELRS